MSCRIIVLTLFLLNWSKFCVFGAERFNNNVLCLLDEREHTYLFRGNIPQRNGEFCYEELRNQIQKYLLKFDKPIFPDFKLICVSLLNSFADRKECKIESNWFKCHPDKGLVWRYPLFGYCCGPNHIPNELRKIFYYSDIDGLSYLMHQLKKMVDYKYSDDIVIYMHCIAGKDRTGEASACYLMQYKGYSYNQAMEFNQQIARRKLRQMSINAIRWYAFYLCEIYCLPSIGAIDCLRI